MTLPRRGWPQRGRPVELGTQQPARAALLFKMRRCVPARLARPVVGQVILRGVLLEQDACSTGAGAQANAQAQLRQRAHASVGSTASGSRGALLVSPDTMPPSPPRPTSARKRRNSCGDMLRSRVRSCVSWRGLRALGHSRRQTGRTTPSGGGKRGGQRSPKVPNVRREARIALEHLEGGHRAHPHRRHEQFPPPPARGGCGRGSALSYPDSRRAAKTCRMACAALRAYCMGLAAGRSGVSRALAVLLLASQSPPRRLASETGRRGYASGSCSLYRPAGSRAFPPWLVHALRGQLRRACQRMSASGRALRWHAAFLAKPKPASLRAGKLSSAMYCYCFIFLTHAAARLRPRADDDFL